MHTILYIDRVAEPDRCAARFTVHSAKGSRPLGPPIELEQLFPDMKSAVFTGMDAIVSHVTETYGIDGATTTMEMR